MSSDKMKVYGVPFAYQKYGRVEVIAKEGATKEELLALAEKELVYMTTADMDAITDYLEDSLGIDEEGEILDWGAVDTLVNEESSVMRSEYGVNIYVEEDGALSFARQIDCLETQEEAVNCAKEYIADNLDGATGITVGIARIDYNEYDEEIGTEIVECVDIPERDIGVER